MRRNPIFAVKDILVLLEMSQSSLMLLIRQLAHDGYLRRISGGKEFVTRTYKLIKNTGVVCPVWVDKQGKLFDANTHKFGIRDPTYVPKVCKKIEHRPVDAGDYDAGRVLQILESEPEGLDLLRLSARSGVLGARFATALSTLVDDGIVEEIGLENGLPVFRLEVCHET